MKTISYVLENLGKYPGFLQLVIVKGILETLPTLILFLGLIVFLPIISTILGGSFLIIFILLFIMILYGLGLLYWYWMLSLAPYRYILAHDQKDSETQQPGIWKTISGIFKYRMLSNVFLIIMTIVLYIFFGTLSGGVTWTVGTIVSPAAFDPTGLGMVLLILSALVLTSLSNLIFSPLYFIVGLIKYNYVSIGRAREAMAKGWNMFLENLGSVVISVLILVLFYLVFQALSLLAFAALYYTILPDYIVRIYQAIVTGAMTNTLILRLSEFLPEVIMLTIVLFTFNLIVSSFLEFIKLILVYNIYRASTKE